MKYFVDIHSHPTIKPYGHSFPSKKNSKNLRSNNSIWYYDPPNFLEKLMDLLGGLVKYRQSSFSAMGFGNTRIILASLYPIERDFFNNKLKTGYFNDMLLNFITSVSKKRIDYIQSITDYFADLENEYNYLKQLEGQIIQLADRALYQYTLAKNAADLDIILDQHKMTDKKVNAIAVIITIEGAHVLGTGIKPQTNPANPDIVLDNAVKVKNWEHRPVFITLAHHFYNELCGHAQSLTGIVKKAVDQSYGMNLGFTPLGYQVVEKLLDNTQNKRILIDIKHMSRQSRLEYINLLETKYKNEDIPIIVSHGAVVGNAKDSRLFLQADINFFDDEIIKVAQTSGLFGLQLDERRIVAPDDDQLRKSHGMQRRKVLFHSSVLIWRQIQHMAELLDSKGLFAWGIQSLGSDFDGMINPLNGYWTAQDYPTLSDYLLKQAYNYIQNDATNLTQKQNHIDPEEIVDRVMGDNAYTFLKNYYH